MEKILIKWLAENFDISRQENYDTVFVYLHDITTVSAGLLSILAKFEAFDGIELRDNCITVIVHKAVPDIEVICNLAIDELKLEIEAYKDGLICSIEFINKIVDVTCRAMQASNHSVCTNYHACTEDNKPCKCILGEVKI